MYRMLLAVMLTPCGDNLIIAAVASTMAPMLFMLSRLLKQPYSRDCKLLSITAVCIWSFQIYQIVTNQEYNWFQDMLYQMLLYTLTPALASFIISAGIVMALRPDSR